MLFILYLFDDLFIRLMILSFIYFKCRSFIYLRNFLTGQISDSIETPLDSVFNLREQLVILKTFSGLK